MTNAELISALRCEKDCDDCAYHTDNAWSRCDEWGMRCDAADALEAAEARIAVVEEERDLERFAAKNYLDKIDELKAQICYKTYVPNDRWQIWVDDELPKNYCTNCGAKMKTVTDCHTLEESER